MATVNIEKSFTFPSSRQTWTGAPLVAANMGMMGTFAVAEVLARKKCITAIHQHYSVDDWISWANGSGKECLPYAAVSCGALETDMEKINQILTAIPELKMMCIDVPNCYSEACVRCIQQARKQHPTVTIIAGSVRTKEMTEELLSNGADIIKLAIGPGSRDQLSIVLECADAAHGLGGRVVSDGGCTSVEDLARVCQAGADFVMLSGMLAGHETNASCVMSESNEYFQAFYDLQVELLHSVLQRASL